ncbi:unnamed protein product [Aspergillus oryzae]|uniref:Unnamed protein product n=2 Tax=Aspergillus oryzae TaxID=5062 RepID=A0AAN4Y7C6_ASPOZ|nr:unnamed protein product [Aspergillus oryzae]GMF95075.1 unnamed protein product [Aspergillus oryzae]GMG07232.1 unnamed protein product [Aspergillus oryzae]GMG24080.1 unnamed protein product [Aspergillus oryzae]GMG46046.1 unnamed protein product [Aspergillus oryzae var. brunneus]
MPSTHPRRDQDQQSKCDQDRTRSCSSGRLFVHSDQHARYDRVPEEVAVDSAPGIPPNRLLGNLYDDPGCTYLGVF